MHAWMFAYISVSSIRFETLDSPMEGSYKQTIAFLGATGGTGLACLAAALKEGHYCTARTSPLSSQSIFSHS
jgi:Flp pilus assembly CpaE family ATPase